MPHIQLRIKGAAVEDWLADISTEFPDAEFRVLTAQPRDDGVLGILEVTTPDGDALVHQFEDATEVRSYEVLHIDEETVLIQLKIPISESYDAIIASDNLPQYPVRLHDGWFSAEVTAPQEQLAAYTAELAAASIPYEIMSLTQSHDSGELLTDRQWEFIIEAVEHGYYDMSRDCTLTELAEVLDINNSAASKLRHRAESRIIREFVAEAAL